MKFKALITSEGVSLLERRFLPALDKVGRICVLYLTRDHVMFLHNLSPNFSSEGVQCIAQFKKDVIFTDYRISSQNDDRIAFGIDLGLLQRALRSAVSILHSSGGGGNGSGGINGLYIQIKLVKKLSAGAAHPLPYLSFETKGYKSAVIHDVPISKPLPRADVIELQSAVDAAQDLPETVVQVPDMVQLQNLVDKLKNVGDTVSVSITQYGDLHLQVSTSLITVGTEFRNLRVLGVRADAPIADQNIAAASRTEMAIRRGEAQTVQVSMKHLTKGLHCHLSKPDAAFYGINPAGACLTMIFQFFISGTRQTDKSISLHCRLPVIDSGSS